VKQSYWEDGASKQLSNLPGLPSITYGNLDGEGRVTQVTASTGISPVNNVSYNNTDPSTSNEPPGPLLSVNLGTTTSGQYDSDSFTYDKNTGRLTNYTFNVNGQTDVGALNWNANGSLHQFAINDSISGTVDSQTCNYTHDDLGRIASVDCGTAWNQTFAYDPFGNITKNGMLTFQPAYNTATNRITTAGFTYDNGGGANSNGNLTNDVYHTYAWDADGKMVSVTSGSSTVNLTYDALGRMVEQQRGSSYTQVVYGPGGGKLALMNGQALAKAFVPLPGRATAVYSASGLQYYRHSDWLGSSRLASTPSRTLYYSGAYAPFGESYKEAGTTDHSFTGQNEDTVWGLEDFMYREYSFPQQGRWISPDPAGLGAVSLTSPQSWNRYAYLSNSPLASTDPLGLWCGPSGTYPCQTPEANGSEWGGGVFGINVGGGNPFGWITDASQPGFFGDPFQAWVDWTQQNGLGSNYYELPGHYNPAAQDFMAYERQVSAAWGALGTQVLDQNASATPTSDFSVSQSITVNCMEEDINNISCLPPPEAMAGSMAWVMGSYFLPPSAQFVFTQPIFNSANKVVQTPVKTFVEDFVTGEGGAFAIGCVGSGVGCIAGGSFAAGAALPGTIAVSAGHAWLDLWSEMFTGKTTMENMWDLLGGVK